MAASEWSASTSTEAKPQHTNQTTVYELPVPEELLRNLPLFLQLHALSSHLTLKLPGSALGGRCQTYFMALRLSAID